MATEERAVRRGLPRQPGGDLWPPASGGTRPIEKVAADPVTPVEGGGTRTLRTGLPRVASGGAAAPAERLPVPAPVPEPVAEPVPEREPEPVAEPELVPVPVRVPEPAPATVPATATAPAPATAPKAAASKVYGPFSRRQRVGGGIVAAGILFFAAAGVVLGARWLLSLDPMQDFLQAYPGEYDLPESAPVGIPAWLGWQHFFNVFLMVLIIRSGLRVRSEKRPTVFWSPRGNPRRKISLTLWFHQALDILWIVNGVVYVTLLFITGLWMKLVPTSWAVFPNALSAGLQYLSLDWPTENGWVNYNSLQQLAYFTTVFIAAPLAIATGVRMSGIWPKKAVRLSKIYPVEWARAVHFPVMIYFVAFIIVHVALVLLTGALRNLNHMYASQDEVSWAGFWIFLASLAVIAVGWFAARPLVLVPIARIFGTVGR